MKDTVPFAEMQTDLERVIQNEVKKKKCHVNIYVCDLKNDTHELICKAETDTEAENKRMDTNGGRGWDELGDWNRHFYTTYSMYQIDNQ